MKIGTIDEYVALYNTPGVTAQHFPEGNAILTTHLRYCGNEVATKTTYYERKGSNKISSESISVNPDFLADGEFSDPLTRKSSDTD